ncbi:lipopolysaccharide biosynthesis protein [Rhodococcus sp. 06-1460-1B]|uniref:lipopolysaccharide biosynthesis protein n=1 Tax=Rhodococcus sp. 06-1460-1B TaxID=2022501 RepID=UPI000B9BD038|nr:oligosaccharide flippase family protein [Rhodococcus sp. 06-1460-1B]OZD63131.1 hypothetical protein CH268_09305 [Rhodococcus sp. 06-1460-1B]
MSDTENSVKRRSGRRIACGAAVYTAMALTQRSVALLLLPFVTHVMSPSEYGLVSVVTVTSLLFSTIFGSAVENAVFRWSVRRVDQSAALVWLCQMYLYVLLPVLGFVIAAIGFIVDIQLLGISTSVWGMSVLAAFLLSSSSFYALPIIRSADRLLAFVFLVGATVVVNVAFKIVFVIMGQLGVQGWVYSELLSGSVAFLLSLALVRRPRVMCPGSFKSLLLFSLPLLPHRVAFWALSGLSRPLLLLFVSASVVGIYSLALNLVMVASLVLAEINKSVLAEYSGESSDPPTDKTARVVQSQFVAAFLVPYFLGLGVFVAFDLIFPAIYSDAQWMIGSMLFGQAAYGIYLVPVNYVVQTSGVTVWSWIPSTVGAAIVFGGIALFAGDHGVSSAIWASVAGYALMAILAFLVLLLSPSNVRWGKLLSLSLPTLPCLVALVLVCAALTSSGVDALVLAAASLLCVLVVSISVAVPCLRSAWSG